MKYISFLCLPYFIAISFLAYYFFHCLPKLISFTACCHFIAYPGLFYSLPTVISLPFLFSPGLFHSLSAVISLLFLSFLSSFHSLPAFILLLLLFCLAISFHICLAMFYYSILFFLGKYLSNYKFYFNY